MTTRQRFYDCKNVERDTKMKAYASRDGDRTQNRVKGTTTVVRDCAVAALEEAEQEPMERLDETDDVDNDPLVQDLTVTALRAIFRQELVAFATGKGLVPPGAPGRTP